MLQTQSALPSTVEPTTELLLAENASLAGSEEYAWGRRELLARIPVQRIWRAESAGSSDQPWPAPAQLLRASRSARWIVICEAALIVPDNLYLELTAAIDSGAGCAIPDDRRSADATPPDYATRLSLEQYVDRLSERQRFAPYDGRKPLMFVIDRAALQSVVEQHPAISWSEVPSNHSATVVCQHTWVHDWSPYQQSDRREMLELLPANVDSLLDIGGGEGGFVQAFLAARGGTAHLLEPSHAGAIAQARGLTVFRQRLGDAHLPRRYTAVAMLETLEHMEDAFGALLAARRLLEPGGFLLLSVPNAGFWRVPADLIGGRFDYLPVGVQCSTHLRFFTATSLRTLLSQAGFEVKAWRDVESSMSPNWTHVVAAAQNAGLPVDRASLGVESFHVLARRD
jgi:2-polyprenyl-3-methyl-5-hydroxy-6-metoxy-1,4-benzoquinol methylase